MPSQDELGSEGDSRAREQRRRLKGKGRARDVEADAEDSKSPRSPAVLLSPAASSEGAREDGDAAIQEYPPQSETEKETRAVEEYLASMYQAEKTRRASVRRTSSYRGSTSHHHSGTAGATDRESKRGSLLFKRMSGLRSESPKPPPPANPRTNSAGMIVMQDLQEGDEDETTPKKPRYAPSPALSINTDVQPSGQMTESPTSVRSPEGSETATSGSMTPVERAVKTGSRFAEDLEWDPVSLTTHPDLKRHSAPVAAKAISPSNGLNRFRLSLQNGSTNSSIFQHFTPSRTSLQMITLPEGDLGEGPRPLPTPQSFDANRSSWYFDGVAGGGGSSLAPSVSIDELSTHGTRTPTSGQTPTKYQRRTSTMTEEEGLISQRAMSLAPDDEHQSADVREAERREKGRGQRWKARQEMGWVQWFCCLGCVIEAEDEDEEGQTGRTGPDLLY